MDPVIIMDNVPEVFEVEEEEELPRVGYCCCVDTDLIQMISYDVLCFVMTCAALCVGVFIMWYIPTISHLVRPLRSQIDKLPKSSPKAIKEMSIQDQARYEKAKILEALRIEEGWVQPEAVNATGGIVSNGGPCASIGMKIMKKYGNAVDSLIATMLCDGLACLQNMGIGGGFVATMYIASESKVVTLSSREVAPVAASKDMFIKKFNASREGALSVAVPGELKGYWEMYKKYGGKAPWIELFEEPIKLCMEGVPVNKHLANNINSSKDFILKSPSLSKLLLNGNGELPKYGDKIKMSKLAQTLSIISTEGPDALYKGTLTREFVKDIKDNSGIITEEDMNSYSVRWEDPVSLNLSSGHRLYSVPTPSSGHILAFILKLLDGSLPYAASQPMVTSIITEAFKYAYALRSHLGDPKFAGTAEALKLLNNTDYINKVKSHIRRIQTSNDTSYYGSDFLKEDHGSANIVVIAPNGDAIVATSSINHRFGSGLVSNSTGILLNNDMDDFSTQLTDNFGVPLSTNNYIAPRKVPMSSMCPSLIFDKNGNLTLAIGAAGGTRITTATALVTMWTLWYNKSIKDSIRKARYHHQLIPMMFYYEPTVRKDIVADMQIRGHNVSELKPEQSCVTAIFKRGNMLMASSDLRRPGNTSYLRA